MSTTLRVMELRLLRRLGLRYVRARSGLGQPFICHLGDFLGELPYYNPESGRAETVLMAAWCRRFAEPIVFDVGGNVGFIASQLAQSLKDRSPKVFSFEPVPHTFERLVETIRRLGVEEAVHPICCALSDGPRMVRMRYAPQNLMLAQVVREEPNGSTGDRVAWSIAWTLDEVVAGLGMTPHMIKVDVEGHEVSVLRGARQTLGAESRPAVCFELNPQTLKEAGVSVVELAEQLGGYDLFYIDDFEGQRLPLGEGIGHLGRIDWVCNVFGVPSRPEHRRAWPDVVAEAERRLGVLRGKHGMPRESWRARACRALWTGVRRNRTGAADCADWKAND